MIFACGVKGVSRISSGKPLPSPGGPTVCIKEWPVWEWAVRQRNSAGQSGTLAFETIAACVSGRKIDSSEDIVVEESLEGRGGERIVKKCCGTAKSECRWPLAEKKRSSRRTTPPNLES